MSTHSWARSATRLASAQATSRSMRVASAAISYALLMERVRRRIESPAEIHELTDKPVVGRLPRQRALRLDYAGVREELAAMGVDAPRAPHV